MEILSEMNAFKGILPYILPYILPHLIMLILILSSDLRLGFRNVLILIKLILTLFECHKIQPMWSIWQRSWLHIQRSRVRLLELPDLL
jgi:hypothetical protein